MKIGILTHYDVNNQGAQLQLYSLYKLLEEWGHVPVVLTYIKNYDINREQKLRNQISLKSFNYLIKNFLLNKGLRLTWHNVKKYKINKKFRLKQMKHDFYTTSDCDCVLVGSDQVFTITMGINIMMFGLGVPCKNLIAYAPCSGNETIEHFEKYNFKEAASEGLKLFRDLSVRDGYTRDLVEKLTGKKVPIVCDPAILNDLSLTTIQGRKIKKKYMVVYAYDSRMVDSEEVAAIKKFAKEKKIITVSVGTYHKWCDKNIACDCLEWLEYFKYADYIITDTFHGAIASILSKQKFALFIRKENFKKMSELVRVLNCQDRVLNEISYLEIKKILEKSICTELIETTVKKLRNESKNYLKHSLERL